MLSDKTTAIHGLVAELGDTRCRPEDIPDFAQLCQQAGLNPDLSMMGCEFYCKMAQPLEEYIKRSASRTLETARISADAIDTVIFSTSDVNLKSFGKTTASKLLLELGLSAACPIMLSLQQCASSLVALEYGRQLLISGCAQNILFIFYDFVEEDCQRITPFALFGDAVVSFVLNKEPSSGVLIGRHSLALDPRGLHGEDDFSTRNAAVLRAYSKLLPGDELNQVDYFLATNLYRPLATMGAAMSGVNRAKLYIETLPSAAHCGICDWAINLNHLLSRVESKQAKKLIVQASAPGFFACSTVDIIQK